MNSLNKEFFAILNFFRDLKKSRELFKFETSKILKSIRGVRNDYAYCPLACVWFVRTNEDVNNYEVFNKYWGFDKGIISIPSDCASFHTLSKSTKTRKLILKTVGLI